MTTMNTDDTGVRVYLKLCKECGLPFEDTKLRGAYCETCKAKKGGL